jgi:hypothetical protein
MGRTFGATWYRREIVRKLGKQSGLPMLVWQMGKVGSSTIYASLGEALPDAPLFHIHMLTEEMLKKGELYQKSQQKGNKAFEFNRCLREAFLDSLESGRHWRIVSIVREPVARNLSAFFQNLDLYYPELTNRGNALGEIPVDDLIEKFLQEFDHDRPMEWFDSEIRGLLGLDVFAEPFSCEDGYRIYRRDRFDLLLIRMEDINRIGASALSSFLDMPEFQLVNRNVGAEKDYADSYRKVKSRIVFPARYLDKIHGSKYARHFYTEQELLVFRRRWEKS